MTEYEAMLLRHSVRQYEDRPIEAEKVAALQEAVDRAKREAGEAANLPEMHWRGGILNDKGALPALSPTPCCRNPARMV